MSVNSYRLTESKGQFFFPIQHQRKHSIFLSSNKKLYLCTISFLFCAMISWPFLSNVIRVLLIDCLSNPNPLRIYDWQSYFKSGWKTNSFTDGFSVVFPYSSCLAGIELVSCLTKNTSSDLNTVSYLNWQFNNNQSIIEKNWLWIVKKIDIGLVCDHLRSEN